MKWFCYCTQSKMPVTLTKKLILWQHIRTGSICDEKAVWLTAIYASWFAKKKIKMLASTSTSWCGSIILDESHITQGQADATRLCRVSHTHLNTPHNQPCTRRSNTGLKRDDKVSALPHFPKSQITVILGIWGSKQIHVSKGITVMTRRLQGRAGRLDDF